MTSLLESINNGDMVAYLPQISVNSANKILDNVAGDSSTSANQNYIVKLDELIENTNENSEQFKQFCDLLALNKSDLEDAKKLSKRSDSNISLTPPLTPVELKPSRVSLRIKTRKQLQSSGESSDHLNTSTSSTRITRRQSSIAKTSARQQSKRKLSLEDEADQDIMKKSRLINNSNDNSIDSSIQTLDLNESDILANIDLFDNDDECSNDVVNFNINNIDENSNEREFKEYVRRTRLLDSNSGSNRSRLMYHQHRIKERTMSDASSNMESGSSTDPVKKESNKEAATRYRLKKLNEKDQLFETRIQLEKENDQVKKKIELVQTEINYLKMLLCQMLMSKGIGSSDLLKC